MTTTTNGRSTRKGDKNRRVAGQLKASITSAVADCWYALITVNSEADVIVWEVGDYNRCAVERVDRAKESECDEQVLIFPMQIAVDVEPLRKTLLAIQAAQ